ncbi:hypothetical protein Q7P37_005089 [Cladosporium fusiforme]
MSPILSTITFALALFGSADAFFRINCANVQRGRIDPLVNPKALAAHSHSIVGGSNIGVNATYQSLLNSRCTTCEVGTDKSAYWSPTLYYQFPNGSFYEVHHNGAVVYYLGRGPNVNKTVPFPKGFMMLSGDKSARSYDNTTMTYGTKQYPGRPVADRVSFNCIDNPIIELPYLHQTNCKNGMRAQIHFQSCWNGRDLYKADNSHVAYQSGIDEGICPPTHPVQIPHIFLEVFYDVNLVPGRNIQDDKGLFVFSQGDPTGYGFHADFQNGWDQNVLANATVNCLATDDFGQISNCPILQASQSNAFGYNCPEMPPQVDEPTRGLIEKLPGCIRITYGPEAASAASMNCPPEVPRPVIRKTVDSTPLPTLKPEVGSTYPTPNQKYLGCYNDTGGRSTLRGYTYTNYTTMTIAVCQEICNSRGFRLSGLEYSMECHCDNYINPEATNGWGDCNWNCGGTMNLPTIEVCGGFGFVSVYNNTNTNDDRLIPPAPRQNVGKYVFKGCLTDQFLNGGRALLGPAKFDDYMTNEMCVKFCLGNEMHFAGIEYGKECYCGDEVNEAGGAVLGRCPAQGPMLCPGNVKQQCGGPSLMTVFYSATL